MNKITFDTFKGIVHPKITILSFTQPQIVPNLYEFLFFLLNTLEDILKNVNNQTVDVFFP